MWCQKGGLCSRPDAARRKSRAKATSRSSLRGAMALTMLGLATSSSRSILAAMVEMSAGSLVRPARQRWIDRASMVGRSPCRFTTYSKAPLRIAQRQGLGDAVGARRQGRIGDDGVAAMGAHRVGDFDLGGGDQHLADIGLHRPLPALHDHRQPVDVGQRLSRKPRGGHPGGDDDDGILVFNHGVSERARQIGANPPYTIAAALRKH